MTKLVNAGDKVRIIGCSQSTFWYSKHIGEVFTVRYDLHPYHHSANNNDQVVTVVEQAGGVVFKDLELVTEDDKVFDMHTQPWFIRVSNPTELHAVVNWLNSKSITSEIGDGWVQGIECVRSSKDEHGKFIRTDMSCTPNAYKEIKLTLKTAVDSVEYPVVETEQQKKIKELEDTIETARQQITELKREM